MGEAWGEGDDGSLRLAVPDIKNEEQKGHRRQVFCRHCSDRPRHSKSRARERVRDRGVALNRAVKRRRRVVGFCLVMAANFC
jgi:hypothetical protein